MDLAKKNNLLIDLVGAFWGLHIIPLRALRVPLDFYVPVRSLLTPRMIPKRLEMFGFWDFFKFGLMRYDAIRKAIACSPRQI